MEDMGRKLVASVASPVVAESSVTPAPVNSQRGPNSCLITRLLSPAPPALRQWRWLLLLCLVVPFSRFLTSLCFSDLCKGLNSLSQKGLGM